MRLLTFLLNLKRRRDRRLWLEETIPWAQAGKEMVFIDAVEGDSVAACRDQVLLHHGFRFRKAGGWRMNSLELEGLQERWVALGQNPPDVIDLIDYHAREVSDQELACFATHHLAWCRADEVLCEPGGGESLFLILEDDVTVFPTFVRDRELHHLRWREVLAVVGEEVERLKRQCVQWDLLYLGRNLHGYDGPSVTERTCHAGFSTCAHAYLLSSTGVRRLLSLGMHDCAIPVDDLLPALYSEHPKALVNQLVRSKISAARGGARAGTAGRFLRALAFKEEMVWQLETCVIGRDDEILQHNGRDLTNPTSLLIRSNIAQTIVSSISSLSATLLVKIFAMALVESDAPAPASMLAMLVETCRLFRDVMTRKQLWRKALLQSLRREEEEPCVVFRSSWLGTYVSMLSLRMNASSIVYFGALRCWRRSGGSGRSGVNSILRRMRNCGARWLREIDSVRMEEVDVGDFKRVYDRGRRPAMLRGCQRAMLGGRGESELTLACLLEIYGNKKSAVLVPGARDPPYTIKMSLGNYCEYMRSCRGEGELGEADKEDRGGEEEQQEQEKEQEEQKQEEGYEPLYFFDDQVPRLLLDMIRPPPTFDDDLLELIAHDRERERRGREREQAGEEDEEEEDERDLLGNPSLLDERRWLVIGPRGSGSRWHVDPKGTSAWNFLISGRKLWIMCRDCKDEEGEELNPLGVLSLPALSGQGGKVVEPPPVLQWLKGTLLPLLCEEGEDGKEKSGRGGEHAGRKRGRGEQSSEDGEESEEEDVEERRRDLLNSRPFLWGIQEAGDVVFIPRGYWHCVLNLEDSVAFTQNFINSANLRSAMKKLEEEEPGMCKLIARAVTATRG